MLEQAELPRDFAEKSHHNTTLRRKHTNEKHIFTATQVNGKTIHINNRNNPMANGSRNKAKPVYQMRDRGSNSRLDSTGAAMPRPDTHA
jgi:hypothetical protein